MDNWSNTFPCKLPVAGIQNVRIRQSHVKNQRRDFFRFVVKNHHPGVCCFCCKVDIFKGGRKPNGVKFPDPFYFFFLSNCKSRTCHMNRPALLTSTIWVYYSFRTSNTLWHSWFLDLCITLYVTITQQPRSKSRYLWKRNSCMSPNPI